MSKCERYEDCLNDASAGETLCRECAKSKNVKRILDPLGVKLSVGGCGCCHSPWVSLEVNGETIIDDAFNCEIDTF